MPDNTRIQNYMSLIAIVPAVLSVTAYEFVDYMLHFIYNRQGDYNPLDALGILIPMALMMELFTYFFSKRIIRKIRQLTSAMAAVASGNYDIRLNPKNMAPLAEMSESFNHMTSELASVETLRKDFINDFSHEFKTPIVSINGFANLILQENLSEEEKREYLTIIADESARLSNLAKQTMLMSRLDTQLRVNPNSVEVFSLDEQIRRCIILLQESWGAKNIDMTINMNSIKYKSDPSLTEHIWINLINNAIKFTPDNGEILIRLTDMYNYEEQLNQIVFTISDNGCGMSEESAQHIFDKYYQADTSHSGSGLGLGLAITKRVVTLCGGDISVQSEPDKGTSFTVTLPATI